MSTPIVSPSGADAPPNWRFHEAPFDMDEPPAPGHLQLCTIWLPDEAGWSAIMAAGDWRRVLSLAQTRLPTVEERASAWRATKHDLLRGYDACMERYGARGGAEFALASGIAACLRPDGGGKLLRRLLTEELDRPRGGARLILLVSSNRRCAATAVQTTRGKQVLQ